VTPNNHIVEVHGAVDAAGHEVSSLIHRAVEQTLHLYAASPYEVGIQIVSRDEIRYMNREFRHTDEATDVLSFAMDDTSYAGTMDQALSYLGDIAICQEQAEEQAAEYGHTLAREFAYLGVHGALHLLGFDHEKVEDQQAMRGAEERVMTILGLPEPHAGT